jgi:hypothetical protein
LVLIVVSMGAVVLLRQLRLGVFALILATLIARQQFSTGTQVSLNVAALLVPSLFFLWIAEMVRRRAVRFVPSSCNRPLLLFLCASLLALLVGNVLWDPVVPRTSSFVLVQLAQWSVFAFSAFAFWLAGNLVTDEAWLCRLAWTFLVLGGGLAILWGMPGVGSLVRSFSTVALIRAPFWVLLAALAGGQLLFNDRLSATSRWFLLAVSVVVVFYAFVWQREGASNWVGVAAVAGVLSWLRFPRLRWPVVVLLVSLTAVGLLIPTVYEFAGGDHEWFTSGGSRLALIRRVVELTLRNPITGLGPAAYRPYGLTDPLVYAHIVWMNPRLSSHNNYVDVFAHAGLLGLGLFLWFLGEVGWLGWRLSRRYQTGFLAGYVNGMFAAWAGMVVIMMLADWFLPFVYNIGFPGFQASVLVWMFLGGLVAVEQMGKQQIANEQMANGE